MEFDQVVRPYGIDIYETFHGGAVVRVQGKDADGNWVTFWEADAPQDVTTANVFSPTPLQVGAS